MAFSRGVANVFEREDCVLKFKVASWFERFESLTEYRCWIFETGKNCTGMNIVEFLTKDPLVFCIVNLKAAIWRNAS